MTVETVPTMEMIVPITLISGPMAATMPATMRIVFCISGERPSHHSLTARIPSATAWIAGVSSSRIVPPTSAPTDFSSFSVVLNSSVGDSVFWKVSSTVPRLSSMDVPSASKLSRPSLIAEMS